MKKTMIWLAVLAGWTGVVWALEPEEEALGFVSLFDGKTFSGWGQGGNWEIEEGAFARRKKGGSLTYTAALVPDDFELRFEWKVSEGCNSGVYYRPGQVEYQVLDNTGSSYGDNPRQAAASLFFCMGPSQDATRPVGEWNTARILCQGSVIDHWLNEERVISFDYRDPKWKAEIDLLAIRGGDLTGRGGRLSLQDHGQDVWYRHLRWREIPEGEVNEPDPDFEPLPVTGAGLAKEEGRVRGMLAARREGAPRPNMVVILADDLGWGDVGCYGSSLIPTPHLDRLAAEGVRMTDAHSPSAICSPSRYGLLTGTDPFRRYHTSHVLFNGEPLVIGSGEDTVATVLAGAGYRTGVVGKWHLGLGDAFPRDLVRPGRGPNELGFGLSFLVPDGHNMGPEYYLEDGLPWGVGEDVAFPSRVEVIDRLGYRLLEHRAEGEWSKQRPGREIGGTLAERAVQFLEVAAKEREQPFFLYLATCAIHTPHLPGERYAGKSAVGAHGDSVMEFDGTVGEVMAALDRLGLAESTLLVVSSDNGGLPGTEKLGHKTSGPWSGNKGSAQEGGHRVPFLARWPGQIPGGRESGALLSLVDIPATAAALAGGFLSPMAARDSFDQSPVLLGKASGMRSFLHVATRGGEELVRREGARKLTLRVASGEARLVDLDRDPGEAAGEEALAGELGRGMLERLHGHLEAGSSRPRALGRGSSVVRLKEEKEERNRWVEERFGPGGGAP